LLLYLGIGVDVKFPAATKSSPITAFTKHKHNNASHVIKGEHFASSTCKKFCNCMDYTETFQNFKIYTTVKCTLLPYLPLLLLQQLLLLLLLLLIIADYRPIFAQLPSSAGCPKAIFFENVQAKPITDWMTFMSPII